MKYARSDKPDAPTIIHMFRAESNRDKLFLDELNKLIPNSPVATSKIHIVFRLFHSSITNTTGLVIAQR